MKHPTNTCDPYTGNWNENLLDLVQLKEFCLSKGYKVGISNSTYSYSSNKVLNLPKQIDTIDCMNALIHMECRNRL